MSESEWGVLGGAPSHSHEALLLMCERDGYVSVYVDLKIKNNGVRKEISSSMKHLVIR